MAQQIQLRNGIASLWTSANPILMIGEMGLENDTAQFKIGDGVTAWNSLPYGGIIGPAGAAGTNGTDGSDGTGVAIGGIANQSLTKINGTDFNTQWSTIDKTFVGLANVSNVDTSTAANITDSANKRFVTDSDITDLANLSGVNTGDQTIILTGGVTGSGTGSFETTVVTNANLTGDVTSVGNETLIAPGVITRSDLSPTAVTGATHWTFLGQGTASNAVRTSTVTWTGTFKQLMIEYFISGYSGSSIGRVMVGPTAGISETATTSCTSLIENVTLNSTSVSVPGWPTAVTTTAVPRYGYMYISNVANTVKRMTGHGQHSGTAPTTVPTQMRMAGLYNNTSTLINTVQLSNYATITTTSVTSATFNAGTYINVWGRNDD